MSEFGENEGNPDLLQKPVTRRVFNKTLAAGVFAVAASRLGFGREEKKVSSAPDTVPPLKIVDQTSPQYTEASTQHTDDTLSNSEHIHQTAFESDSQIKTIEKLNTILKQDLFIYERNEAEMEFAENVQSLKDIDLGLSVCAELGARIRLLEKRAEIRAKGTEGMIQLTDVQKAFCAENGVDEEILGMCLDAYEDAKAIIRKVQPKIRADEEGKLVDPEKLMINPGGMAKLIMEETSGFKTIGSKKAITQLFGPEAQNNTAALTKLCELLSDDTGLNFDPNNVPGSDVVDFTVNESGGAIGIQFMPGRALDYYNLFKEAGEDGNIFDPLQSIKMAWTFVACHERVAPGPDGFRWGYMRGNDKAIDFAIRKWNDLDSEVNAIKGAAYDYYEDVVSSSDP